MGIESWSHGASIFQPGLNTQLTWLLEESMMTSEGSVYGAIPLIINLDRNTLFSVDQCQAAHAEKDLKPKARRGASATCQVSGERERVFRGYHILEPEEQPWGGRELYRMEEDEGLLEIALDYWDDESILADGHSGDGVVHGGGGKELAYEHGREEHVLYTPPSFPTDSNGLSPDPANSNGPSGQSLGLPMESIGLDQIPLLVQSKSGESPVKSP